MLKSLCRQQILRVLAANREMRVMKLVEATKFSYNEVNRNLSILNSECLVSQHYRGRGRVVSLNFENEELPVLLKAIRFLNPHVESERKMTRKRVSGVSCEKQTTDNRASLKRNFENYRTGLLALKTNEDKNYKTRKAFVPDVISLLRLQRLLRKIVIALYKMNKATIEDLQLEASTSEEEIDRAVNRLLSLGLFGKEQKKGARIFT